jgi:P-type Cu2+ transporter
MNSTVTESAFTPRCYHCGLPIPAGVSLFESVSGAPRAMCCRGCQAVASTIAAHGLAGYYETRDALPETPREATPAAMRELAFYDQPSVQRDVVSQQTPGQADRIEAALLLEGIRCGACVWLIEHRLRALPGVEAFTINFATQRARVVWNGGRIRLSEILAAVGEIGYRATPYDAGRSEAAFRLQRNDYLKRLFVAGFGMMQVMMYAVPVYLATAGSMDPDLEQLMRWASLMLTVPVVFYSAWPIFHNAMRDIRAGRAGMDVPVALGIAVAFSASAIATATGGGQIYFDSISMFVFLLLGARFFEFLARRRAAAGIERLTQSAPAIAQRLIDFPSSLTAESVPALSLVAGDHVLVGPGGNFPADGVVVSGDGSVDESLLTGESMPVRKNSGSPLIGGAINLDAPFVMRVIHAGAATRLAAIVRLLDRALSEKPHIVVLADRVAVHFVTALLFVTLATGIVWLLLDPARAPWVIVAVLVVTCPCALSLATPAALAAATAKLAAAGALVTRGHAIETLARADCFVFDKTGTLTMGNMRLAHTVTLGELDAHACVLLAAAMEQGVEHPIARAIRAAAAALPEVPEKVRVTQGAGIEATVGGLRHRVGSPDFVAALTGTALPDCSVVRGGYGHTVVALGNEQGWLAAFTVGDSMRTGAPALVDSLLASGARIVLLSGDARGAVEHVADALHIADRRYAMSPEDKHAAVVELQKSGAVVAMVGDGVNDAPVLAQAQVSVAIGAGAALAHASADMVLLNPDLSTLAEAVAISHRCMQVIRQNLAWALAYNAVALPLAIGGWLTPWLAGIGMAASSLLVVINALRVAMPRRARHATLVTGAHVSIEDPA